MRRKNTISMHLFTEFGCNSFFYLGGLWDPHFDLQIVILLSDLMTFDLAGNKSLVLQNGILARSYAKRFCSSVFFFQSYSCIGEIAFFPRIFSSTLPGRLNLEI